jgi:hypothetical protein
LEQVTDSTGRYFFDSTKVKSDHTYIITVFGDKSGYYNGPNAKITTVGYSAGTKFIHDFELKKCEPIIDYFPSVGFEKNAITFKASQTDSLNIMFMILMDNPNVIMEIMGHCSFDEKNAQHCSEARANEVKNYLLKKGIPQGRLIVKAYGTSKAYIDRKGKTIDMAEINKEETLLLKKKGCCNQTGG